MIRKIKNIFANGAWIVDTKTILAKLNEIIDYLNDGSSQKYTGKSPTNVSVGNLQSGSNIAGLTYNDILQAMFSAYISPSFDSFLISGQSQNVEVGTTLSGPKTFAWSINPGSGIINTVDIYNNTLSTTLIAGILNNGSQFIAIPSINFSTSGQTQSYKIIGNNSFPSSTFDSSNFVITANYLEFYGPTSANSVTSAQVRALPFNRFTNISSTFSFDTGTTQRIFEIALPPSKTILSVFDATAGTTITNGFTSQGITVNNAAGNSVSYNIFRLTNSAPYNVNHVFNVTTI